MDDRSRQTAARLELPLLVAALLTIPAIVIEESGWHGVWPTIGTALNWTVWGAFLAEVVIMLRVVPDRGRWLRTHPLELAIVILTPPFLPASLQAARVFRLVRIARVFRAAAITRRLLSTEGVRDVAVLAAFTVLGGGAAYSAVEKVDPNGNALSTWDGVWWAMSTVTTVGYGDNYPSTTGGRIIAMVVMLVGIGFVAVLTAAAASRFMHSRRQEQAELERVEQRLDEVLTRLAAIEAQGRL